MKTLYQNDMFIYYMDENGGYRFADDSSDVALTGPIDPEDVIWDEHYGYILSNGEQLPWADE